MNSKEEGKIFRNTGPIIYTEIFSLTRLTIVNIYKLSFFDKTAEIFRKQNLKKRVFSETRFT
jgi:hypothetical protein